MLSDGSVVVGLAGVSPQLGNGDGRFAIAKILPNGELDTAFNAAGPTPGIYDLQFDGLVDIDIDSTGRILVAGVNTVTRFFANGVPDPSFVATRINPCVPGGEQPLDLTYGGGTGVVYPPVANTDEQISGASVDGPDRIMLQLIRSFPSGPPSLARIDANGNADQTFGTGGRLDLSQLGAYFADPVFVQADHRIIVEVRPRIRRPCPRPPHSAGTAGRVTGFSAMPQPISLYPVASPPQTGQSPYLASDRHRRRCDQSGKTARCAIAGS